jgi:hypothetical protein
VNVAELDRGWEDVLRRAHRRPYLSRRVVVIAVAVVAVATAAPALGVLLTRPQQPSLPRDQIGGNTINYQIDPITKQTLLEYGRWRGHDGVCYLVPHVRAGCLRTGQSSPRFISLPLLMTVAHPRLGGKSFVAPNPRFGFRVVALPGGRAKLVRR